MEIIAYETEHAPECELSYSPETEIIAYEN